MTGLHLGPWADVVVNLRVEIALHDIFLIVTIVSACPTAWGIGDLHQTAATFSSGQFGPSMIESDAD